MIISPGRNYIFVHIPKTAGTAMALALESRAKKDDMMLGDTPKALKRRRRLKDASSAGRLWKHSTLADVEGLVSSEQIRSSFVFTLVRNPWDRMVSYYHWLKDQGFDHPAVRLAQELPFQSFVQHRQTIKSFQNAPFGSYVQLGEKEVKTLFIRIEHFATDARPLWDHLGFELGLTRVNTSDRAAEFQSYYDDVTRQALETACAADIARFGYQF